MSEAVVDVPSAAIRVSDVTILLVEDDDGDAFLVRASLEDAGVPPQCIVWRRTLADAIATLDSSIGCVLLDLGLPDADGFGAVMKTVAAAPNVPVIVLTGRQERDGTDALAAGAQDYLGKDSVTAELLEHSIRYAIERKRAQAAQQQLHEARISAAEQGRLERGLLPTPLLRSDAFGCATYYCPGDDRAVLGGDFFDVVETPAGQLRAVIGDVMGHGPDEAALGVHLRVAWRALLMAGTPDSDILPTLAELLSVEGDHFLRYATVCDVTIDGASLAVRLAGHPAPILHTVAGTAYPQMQVGLPLGVRLPGVDPASWPVNRVDISPGASVVLYTDGLLDAYDAGSASAGVGIPELVRAVDDCTAAGGRPETWIPSLLAKAPRESIDDIAVVVLTVPSE